MKSAQLARLDRDTPKWPEIRATLGDNAAITISGVTRPLATEDKQAEIVALAGQQARANDSPIRLTVRRADGALERLIVALDDTVARLDHAQPVDTPAVPPAGDQVKPPRTRGRARSRSKSSTNAAARKRGTGFLGFFSPRNAGLIKWAGAAFAALVVAAAIVIAVKAASHGQTPTTPDEAKPASSAPAAAKLYTDLAPPGWSQQAWWALPLATGTTPVTDSTTGMTVLVSATDNTSAAPTLNLDGDPAQHTATYLAVVDRAGRGVWSTPLDNGLPAFGPTITTVDHARVVLIGDDTSVTYWPLGGGNAHTVALPDGTTGTINTQGDSVMFTLNDGRLGYLHNGSLQLVQPLPHTTAAFAVDGAVVSTQADTGSWWTQRADASPSVITPKPPFTGAAIQQILAATPQAVIIAWAHRQQPAGSGSGSGSVSDKATVIAYATSSGAELARTTTDSAALDIGADGQALYSPAAGITAAGSVVLTGGRPSALTVTPGLTVTAAQDAAYGSTSDQDSVAIQRGRTPTALPAGTLIPVGYSAAHLMVITQDTLYALRPASGIKSTTVAAATPRPAVTRTVTAPAVTRTAAPTTVKTSVTRTVRSTVTVTPTTASPVLSTASTHQITR
ncbi:MAG: hypothetical protein ACR2P2_13035 [Nakamurella sp.]